MGDIKAIETQYAGHRFRSRLEARWAVFFDHLGVEWEYEAQGYETAGGRYLPDFWLPGAGVWAEVKGVMSKADFIKTMRAIPDLRKQDSHQIMPQLVLLGSVPRPGLAWTHTRIDVFADQLMAVNAFWCGTDGAPYLKSIHIPVVFRQNTDWEGAADDDVLWFCRSFLGAGYDERLTVDPLVDAAYAAARSARFEFGESGA